MGPLKSGRWAVLVLALVAGPALAQEAPRLERLESRQMGPTGSQLAAGDILTGKLAGARISWDPATGCPRSVHLARPVRVQGQDTEGAIRFVFRRLNRLYAGQLKLQTGEGPPRAKDGAYLAQTNAATIGATRILTFEQRVGTTPVDGSELKVVFVRRKGKIRLRGMTSRVFRDVPVLADAQPAAPPAKPARLGKLKLDLGKPRVVLTPLPAGTWHYAVSGIEMPGGYQPDKIARVLRTPAGKEIARVPLGQTGWVTGPVVGSNGTDQQPLPDLFVRTDGHLVATDREGTFPGNSGSLPLGITGRLFRVIGQDTGLPSGKTIQLDPDLVDSTNVYYNLNDIRDWLRRDYPSLPRRVVDARILAVVGLADYTNACNFSIAQQDGGESYDHIQSYGNYSGGWSSRRASTITHERGHALLNDLGFTSAGMAAGGVHEGTGDYLAAVRLNTPKVTRDLSILKVWPKDAGNTYGGGGWGKPHRVGHIWGGAMWDARNAITLDQRKVLDMSLFQAAPTLGPSSTLLDGRDAVLAAARGNGISDGDCEKIVEQFARHGIGRGEKGKPPVITVSPDESTFLHDIVIVPGKPHFWTPLQYIYRGDAVNEDELPQKLVFEARDPDGKPVELFLEYAKDETPGKGKNHGPVVVTSGDPARLEWTLHPEKNADAGHYVVQLFAEDADGEQTRIFIDLWAAESREAQTRKKAYETVWAKPGEMQSYGLDQVLGNEGHHHISADANKPSWVEVVMGPAPKLVVRPPAEGAEGVHAFKLDCKAGGETNYDLRVNVVVGVGPFLKLYHSTVLPYSHHQDSQKTLGNWVQDVEHLRSELPAGRPLVVRTGGTLEVVVAGFADRDGPLVELSLETEIPGVTLTPANPAPTVREADLSTRGAQAAYLWVRPPLGAPRDLLRIPVVAKVGEKTTRRVLEVFVQPPEEGDNQAPVITAPAEVTLGEDGVTFDLTVTDPDGDKVRVELLGATTDTIQVQTEEEPKWQGFQWVEEELEGRATVRQAGRIHLRATDLRGAITLHAVDVKPQGAHPRPHTGITEGVDNQ